MNVDKKEELRKAQGALKMLTDGAQEGKLSEFVPYGEMCDWLQGKIDILSKEIDEEAEESL